ncbi:ABC transporter permease [Streptomyces sp. CA-106131]|uniref:ABC transporter permease n=1 Tax=Streptomyces sp. CA-106131 TaxID=3240045 RepID=UPI003D8E263C
MMRGALERSAREYGLPLVVLLVTWVSMAVTTPTFRGESSVYSVLEGFPLLGLVGLGLAVTIIAGELDFSVGSMAALAGVVAVKAASGGLVTALVVAVALGAAIGAVQGAVIARLRISSLVVTVGTLILLRGLAYLLSHNAPTQLTDFAVSDSLLPRYGIFSLSSLVALVIFGLMGCFLAFTRYGREIYAIGGARREAQAAGVPTVRPMVTTFAISAACASLAGALASVKGGSAAPANYAEVLLVGSAAALIGGISLYGGRGTVLHVALGVATLSAISSGLAAHGSNDAVTQLVTGALLVAVVAIEFSVMGLTRRARLRRAMASDSAHPPFMPAVDAAVLSNRKEHHV